MATDLAKTTAVLDKEEYDDSSTSDNCTSVEYDVPGGFDLTLICHNRTFLVHRAVLFKLSRVVADLAMEVEDGMWASDLDQLDSDTIDILLKYIYRKAPIPDDLPLQRYMDLLQVAQTLKIKEADDAIHRTLLKNENDNFLVSLWNKYESDDKEVTDKFHRYIVANIKELNGKKFFGKLNHRQFFTILSVAQLYSDVAAGDVLEATMQWLGADGDNRRCFASEIYPLINWAEITPELSSCLTEPKTALRKLFGNSANSQEGVTEQILKRWSTTALNSNSSQLIDALPHGSFGNVLKHSCKVQHNASFRRQRNNSNYFQTQSDVSLPSVSGNEGRSSSDQGDYSRSDDSFECLVKSTGFMQQGNAQLLRTSATKLNGRLTCRKLEDLSKATPHLTQSTFSLRTDYPVLHSVQLSDHFRRNNYNPAVAVFGVDFDGRIVLRLYVLQWKVWSEPIELDIPYRRHFATAFYNRKIFIIGGNDANSVGSRNTFVFQVQKKLMYPSSNLEQERLGAGVALLDGYLYVVGGRDKTYTHHLRSAEVMLVKGECSKWEEVALMNHGREHPGLVVANKRLYVIGGFTNSCEYFDVQGNKWIRMKSLPDRFRLSGMHAVLHHQSIYSFRRNDPADMCILNLKSNGMRLLTVDGEIPPTIVGCGMICGQIWAVDQNAELFSFLPERIHWKKTHIRSPPNSFHLVLEAQIVNQTELEGLFTFPKD